MCQNCQIKAIYNCLLFAFPTFSINFGIFSRYIDNSFIVPASLLFYLANFYADQCLRSHPHFPYYSGQFEMQTMMHEQSGLPDTSYEETPLLGAQAETQNSWDALTRLFPRASAIDLETSYSKTG